MKQKFMINNESTHRHTDENGYVYVDESPILRSGVLEYYGSELIDGSDAHEIDGVQIDPDKVYKVYISDEELEKGADSFKLLPITNDHEWLGRDGANAHDFQEGSTGETVTIRNGMIYLPLKFTGDDIIAALNDGKHELSASYTHGLNKSDNDAYDFIATGIKGNHIALVEKGRCGPDVRVLNSTMEQKQMKSKNDVKLIIDGKEINLDEFFAQEQRENEHDGTGSIVDTDNEDKREIIREIMAIAGKSNEDFEGGEDEKVREIAKLAEKLAYNPSEESQSDNEDKDSGTDDDASKDSKSDNEDKDDTDDDKDEDVKDENACKSHNSLVTRIANAVAQHTAKRNAGLKRAYNAASEVMGEFNPFGMSERDMLVRALNHAGISVDKETTGELYAMLKVCNSAVKVDNAFNYGASGSDEVEINI